MTNKFFVKYPSQWHSMDVPTDMAVSTTEADEAVASSVFAQIMGIPLKKKCWLRPFWSFLVTSPRLILRSGYGYD